MEDELLKALRNAALAALKYLRSGECSSKVVGRGSFGDVTKVFDKEAEEAAIRSLREDLRNVLIVSEEVGIMRLGDSPQPEWVVIMDPVDGSTNFDAGIPWTAVALAAARWRDGGVRVRDVEAAVVAEVFRDVIYEFSVDSGVKVNGEPARRRSPPAKVLLGYFEVPEAYSVVPEYWRIRGGRAALRSLGSAALDIISVGLGRAEAFVDARAKLRNVDVAASLRIVHELGSVGGRCAESGVETALDIRIDTLVKVPCLIVGYNEKYFNMLARAVRSSFVLKS